MTESLAATADDLAMEDPATGAVDMLARYQAAEVVLDASVMRLVLNESVRPNWVGANAFWYRRELAAGGQYIWVGGGELRAAFDHAAAASALETATGQAANADLLMAESVTADGECVLYHAGRRWRVVSGVAEDLGAIEGAKPEIGRAYV